VPAAAPSSSVVVAPKAEVVGEAVAPAPAIPEAPVAQATPAPTKAAPIKEAPSRPLVRKAIAHPMKKAAKPKYDPDALFFKGN
jgi:hypothetical protein